MGAAAAALAPLEIAVGRGGAALAGSEHIRVHAEAHRAAGVAPLESRLAKHAIQSFLLRLRFDALRSGHHHRAYARRHMPAAHDARRGAEILDPGVGARAEE